MDALLIIDLQNDFLPLGALEVPGAERILPVINQLLPCFSLVVASQDEHPQGHISFASTKGRQVGEEVNGQELWPDHCIEGTFGAALSSAIDLDVIKKIFKKGTHVDSDSYSAFFNDAKKRKSTGLNEFLKEHGVNKIFIVGLALEYCVAASAIDALMLGYEVTLIQEGSASLGTEGDRQSFFESLENQGVKIISIKSFI